MVDEFSMVLGESKALALLLGINEYLCLYYNITRFITHREFLNIIVRQKLCSELAMLLMHYCCYFPVRNIKYDIILTSMFISLPSCVSSRCIASHWLLPFVS